MFVLDCYACSLSFVLLQSAPHRKLSRNRLLTQPPLEAAVPHTSEKQCVPGSGPRLTHVQDLVGQRWHLGQWSRSPSIRRHITAVCRCMAAVGSRSAGCGVGDGAQFWPAADPATWVFCRLRGSADSPRPFTRQRPQIRSPVVFHRKRRFSAGNMTAGNRRLG